MTGRWTTIPPPIHGVAEAGWAHQWHRCAFWYAGVTGSRCEPSGWVSSGSRPQQGTGRPAPQVHARSTSGRPGGECCDSTVNTQPRAQGELSRTVGKPQPPSGTQTSMFQVSSWTVSSKLYSKTCPGADGSTVQEGKMGR